MAVAAPSPADAATALKNTTYKGTGGQTGVDTTVKFTLKVGSNPNRINRATVEVSCPTAHNKLVFKNIKIMSGGTFQKDIYFPNGTVTRFRLDGTVKTRHKIEVDFSTADSDEPCGAYVMEGSAHD
jgi:hypothetical protein